MKKLVCIFVLVLLLIPLQTVAAKGRSENSIRLYADQVSGANDIEAAIIEVTADVAVPADLATRPLPKQSQNVDAAAIAAKARIPPAPAGQWQIEFAPLTRMQAWGMGAGPKVGDRIEVIGYTGPEVAGGRLMRVEYVFHQGRVAGLRSSPAN